MNSNIKLISFDFDGVFTNGQIQFDSKGEIIKSYNVKDGYIIKHLKTLGIKTGIISSYKYNESCKKICNHLDFDYIEIGTKNKLEKLGEWLDELNITIEQVAYIGDDISDLEILKAVGISGCPQDAINECKNHVDYICQKKGGEGCVREFVEYILNMKKDIMFNLKKEFSYQINNIPQEDIDYYVKLLIDFKYNVYFTGVGKSKNMATHTVDILRSIGISAFYLDPINGTHGDIGPIVEEDIVFLYSNSGNTEELVNLSHYLGERGTTLFGIVCNGECKLKDLCNKITVLPITSELHYTLPIPTNSCMVFLTFCNMLSIQLVNKMNLSIDKYKLNHPSGNIGKNLLLTVKDVMIKEFPKIILESDKSIDLHNVFLQMTDLKIGCCFFINNENNLLGLMTDGDIRRLLVKKNISKICLDDINKNYYHISDINKRIINLDLKKHSYIPIITDNKIIGIIDKLNR